MINNIFDIDNTDFGTQEWWNKYITAAIYILHLKHNLTMDQIGAMCCQEKWREADLGPIGGQMYYRLEEFMQMYKLPR